MTMTADIRHRPLDQHALPASRARARESRVDRRGIDMVFYLLIIAVTALVFAVKTWGLVALTLTAVSLVPMIFAMFIWMCWPFPARGSAPD